MAQHKLTLLVTMLVAVFPGVTACELIFCPLSQSDGTPVGVTGTADVIVQSEELTHCALKCQRDNCNVFTFDEEDDVCSLYDSVPGMTMATLQSPKAYQVKEFASCHDLALHLAELKKGIFPLTISQWAHPGE